MKVKLREAVLSSLIVFAVVFAGFTYSGFGHEIQSLSNETTTIEVSSYEELQTVLASSNEDSEIVVTQEIVLPDNAEINGNGAIVRVVNPYIGEDGIVRDGEYSAYNLFKINEDVSATIKNMTIFGGKLTRFSSTGAVYNEGLLNMENVTIMRSFRGLVTKGTAVLKNCNIVRNICRYGGGILCDGGKIVMDGCSLSENYTSDQMGGGAMEIKNGGELYANNTVILNNSSGEIGGAINCYSSKIWLSNCTISGNVTTSTNAYEGGGIGLNGESSGLLRAVNTIITDNYQIVGDTKVRCDIGIYSDTNSELINCVYGEIVKKQDMFSITLTDCKQDTSSTFAARYRSDGVLIKDDAKTIDFYHPAAATKVTGTPALFVPVKTGSQASVDGVKTYFDYSDLSDIKMGYGEPDSITALGDLTEPQSTAQVVTYYEGGERAEGVIGASQLTDASYHTITLANGFSHGIVSGATVYGDTYLDGTTITVKGIADNGYVIKYWIATGIDNTEFTTINPYEFVVTEDIKLIPVFIVDDSTEEDPEPQPEPEKQMLPVWAVALIAAEAGVAFFLFIMLLITSLKKKSRL